MASGQENAGRILIVEDDGDIREVVAQILEHHGYQVEGAADGEQALALLREGGPPHLILLDLMMPGMNGWSFHAELLREKTLAAIPVVILSGVDDPSAAASAMGAAGALGKPVFVPDLLAMVESLLEEAPGAHPAAADTGPTGELPEP